MDPTVKWDYLTETHDKPLRAAVLNKEYGEKGWELVGIVREYIESDGNELVYTFKRKRPRRLPEQKCPKPRK